MRELNAAWEVIRDPEQRAAYDRRRPVGAGQRSDRVTPPTAVPAYRAPVGLPPDGVPDLEPEVEGAPTVVRHRRWSAYGPVIVVGALVLVIAMVLALATLGAGPDPENVETTERFPAGSCVVVTDSRIIEEAVCGSPGAVLVVGRADFPSPCPSKTAAVVMIELNQSLCVEIPASELPRG